MRLRDAIIHGNDAARKGVAQALVYELVVEARDRVRPTFRVRREPRGATTPWRTGSRHDSTVGGRGFEPL